jgi:ABC-type polysaccharide/polyol phosphate transport system ATPase subunit
MSSEVGAVALRGVDKWFEPYGSPRLRRAIPGERGEPRVAADRGTMALRGVDLVIPPGQAVGIIGRNGAGKSTLLRLLAGISPPTRGSISVEGRLAAIIELGVGLHPDLTGWENLRLAAALRGIPAVRSARFSDAVAEFSGLGDALAQPLKQYSTGMAARLGFSVATHSDADILAVDEAISVGDREFQIRCIERIRGLLDEGVTLLFVTHDLWLVAQLCERAVVLEDGRIVLDGDPGVVVPAYLAASGEQRPVEAPLRGGARVTALRVLNPVIETGDRLGVEVDLELGAGGDALEIETSLTLPPFGPWATDLRPLPPALGPEVTLRGVTDEILAVGRGEFGVTIALVADGEVLDRSSAAFQLEGEDRRKPNLKMSVDLRWDPASAPTVPPPPRLEQLEEAAIRIRDLTKRFDDPRRHRLRRALPLPLDPTGPLALDRVSLDIAPGTFLGLIGPNGAGKSTLLKAIAGITRAQEGTLEVVGKVVSMIELGVGFHPDLTGDENLQLAGQLLGLAADELAARYDEIVDFSGIRHAMSEPVKHYSTGMVARLGFALATHVPSDVLLVDEMLSVGDAEFRERAIERMEWIHRGGTTIVLVSHDLRLVAEVCEQAALLSDGGIVDVGPAQEVVDRLGGTDLEQADPLGLHDGRDEAPIRVSELEVTPRSVTANGTLAVTALLEVAGVPGDARIDLCLAEPFPPGWIRSGTANEVYDRAVSAESISRDEPIFDGEGRWRLTASLGTDSLRPGPLDVVLLAVDELSGEILSEARRPVRIRGRSDDVVGVQLETAWSVVT